MISSNKAKLKAYCDANQLDEQIAEAERRKDSHALEALNAKADGLERQFSPEYTKVMDGLLEEVDPIMTRRKANRRCNQYSYEAVQVRRTIQAYAAEPISRASLRVILTRLLCGSINVPKDLGLPNASR